MIELFSGETANEVWQCAATSFRSGEEVEVQPSRAGKTREILHVGFSIQQPVQRWVTSRSPALNPAFALAEVIWILRGRSDIRFLEYWNSRITDYVGEGPDAHGAYGPRLRSSFGIDQLERAYHALENNSETRQVVLQIFDPKWDLPLEDGSPVSNDIPCNISSMLKIRDGRLHWTQVIRSNDLFLGVPHNFVQFTSLQEIMAGWLDVKVGCYNQIADSLHIYDEDQNSLEDSVPTNHVERNEDSLRLPKDTSDKFFAGLEERVVAFISERLQRNEHQEASKWYDAPEAIQNILCVLAAEAARRRQWIDMSVDIMQECSNPAYNQLWAHWVDRVES